MQHPGTSYQGLHKRPTYEELADYIRRDPDVVKTPDRTALLLRDHHMLSWLHDIKDYETRQEEADEERSRGEQFRRLRTLGVRVPPALDHDEVTERVARNADVADLRQLREIAEAFEARHPVEFLPGSNGPAAGVSLPTGDLVRQAMGIPLDAQDDDMEDEDAAMADAVQRGRLAVRRGANIRPGPYEAGARPQQQGRLVYPEPSGPARALEPHAAGEDPDVEVLYMGGPYVDRRPLEDAAPDGLVPKRRRWLEVGRRRANSDPIEDMPRPLRMRALLPPLAQPRGLDGTPALALAPQAGPGSQFAPPERAAHFQPLAILNGPSESQADRDVRSDLRSQDFLFEAGRSPDQVLEYMQRREARRRRERA